MPRGWLTRLRQGLSRSSDQLRQGMAKLIGSGSILDKESLGEMEDILIAADMGVIMASQIVGHLERYHWHEEVSSDHLCKIVADLITKQLDKIDKPLVLSAGRPHVLLLAGVNGVGKTTTAAKLAYLYKGEGARVMLVAADTHRAAAADQLQIWSERVDCPIFRGDQVREPAALVHDAWVKAKDDGIDLMIIDTAGRLHNHVNLMEELAKIRRVLTKLDEHAPQSRVLTIDAITGQNAINQVEKFNQTIDLNGLIVTKLDTSARGGIVVALAEKFSLPVHAIGVGENLSDLRPFSAASYARSLMGIQG